MTIESIRLLTQGGQYVLAAENGICRHDDVTVELSGGNVAITGGDTAVIKLEIDYRNDFFQDAMVLCDAFERGYAEFEWKKPDYNRLMPWYFAANENGKTFCFGVKTRPDALCCWRCDENRVTLIVDIRNGKHPLKLNGRRLKSLRVGHD